jgi:xylulose-5-phosphate/fructose-6-phosphate phosphoketolase
VHILAIKKSLRILHGRPNPERFHVRSYKEEGATTPFDMVVLNEINRYHLAIQVLQRVPRLSSKASGVIEYFQEKLIEHRQYIDRYLEDMPEVTDWVWSQP